MSDPLPPSVSFGAWVPGLVPCLVPGLVPVSVDDEPYDNPYDYRQKFVSDEDIYWAAEAEAEEAAKKRQAEAEAAEDAKKRQAEAKAEEASKKRQADADVEAWKPLKKMWIERWRVEENNVSPSPHGDASPSPSPCGRTIVKKDDWVTRWMMGLCDDDSDGDGDGDASSPSPSPSPRGMIVDDGDAEKSVSPSPRKKKKNDVYSMPRHARTLYWQARTVSRNKHREAARTEPDVWVLPPPQSFLESRNPTYMRKRFGFLPPITAAAAAAAATAATAASI